MTPARFLLAAGLALALPASAGASADPASCPGKVYGKGKRAICLPLGAASFADHVVSFTPGERPSEGIFADPAHTLGEPDFVATSKPGFQSQGCDGELVLRFDDNRLLDVPGPDLFVFEVGPAVEAMDLAISQDGATWIEVGRIEGARSDVDIAGTVDAGESFSFVRLRNASKQCGGRHSGADVDAVAAVGSALRLSLDSAVLFDVGQASLRPEAAAALDGLAAKVRPLGKSVRLDIEGHTDSTGSETDNRALSEARAAAVWRELQSRLQLPDAAARITGRGESQPVADNGTEAGRALNRRVDIVLHPGG